MDKRFASVLEKWRNVEILGDFGMNVSPMFPHPQKCG